MRRLLVSLVLATLAALAAILLLLAAFDVRRWEQRTAEDDVRFGTFPAARLWQADALLPGDPTRTLLSLADDLRYRRAMQAFVVSRPRENASLQPELEAAKVEAQVRLSDVAQREPDGERRSELLNLLGALTIAAAQMQQQPQRFESLQAAVAYFAAAVRLDRSNEDALFNLEVLQRALLHEEPPSLEAPGGRLPRIEASLGGLRNPGAGY
jgi:hypothetical protein